ncbi:MAG TPA: tetratricopeptide repeat protein, partial [Candidatus Cloacimonadota bacterium]|nr:tetratricopeptide repeat protein [Candidatus Cloacimonadota bacterium]
MRNNKHTLILLLVFGVIASFLWSDVNDDLRVIYGLYQDNNYNLTLQEIQRFKSNYPDNDKIEILKSLEGNIALHRQKYALADSIFNSVDLTNLDEETQASLLLGRIQSKFMLGDYAASAQFVTQFMKRYPNTSNYWQAIYWSAKLDIQFQKYDDAINSLKMIQDKPEREMIYSTLIEALSLNQNTNESETYLKRMILDFPNSEFTHQSYLNQMQALYAAGKLDSLRTYLGYFIPDHSIYYNDYLLLQGKICYTLTDYDSSLKYLNKIQPENEDSKFYQGLNYYQLRQDSKAKEIFSDLANKAKDNQVRSNSFLQNQIMLYETDSKAALFNMEWYIQNHPDDPLLGAYYFQVGYCQYKQNKYSIAFTNLTKAVSYRLDPITED